MVGTHPSALLATNVAEPDPTIVTRFAQTVALHAGDLAVRGASHSLTYAELDRRSSALAGALASQSDSSPIGILLGQGTAAIVAMVAALKTGRPFVALDPMLPPARLGQIIRLAGVGVCVTEPAHATLLAAARDEGGAASAGGPPPAHAPRTVLVNEVLAAADSDGAAAADTGHHDLTGYRALPGDPAFLVFSSGSTGVPKGVIWRHRTMLKELDAGIDVVGISPADQIALVLPTAFAAGITVMFWGLLTGATLHPFDPRARGIGALPAWLAERGITTLHLTPALLRALVGAADPGQALPTVRAVTSSGEAVYGRDVAALRGLLPADCTFYNWSGSTETASLAFFPIRLCDELPDGRLPAGWAVDGKTIEVVGESGRPVPDGTTGLLSITSRYLSGGYWNAPELTADRFRPGAAGSPGDGLADAAPSGDAVAPADAVAPPADEVVYRGGDLARRRPDGCLELLGRADAAVKIGGYLVEPAEIETVLATSPDVVEAVVVAEQREGEPPRLIAYVVCETSVGSPVVSVRALLREKLPAYMVPAAVVPLTALPRNERGKVDRQALPPPPARLAPTLPAVGGPLQNALRDLFAQILKIDDVGPDEDFLELGGNSLLAQQLMSEIATRLGVTLPTSALAQAPTAATLAARVASAARNLPTHPTCVPLNTGGTRPPLFCVASAGGLAINFLALARRLGPDQPVYGLQARGLEQRALPDWTVERNARRHVAQLRVIQPSGPYHLAGFSFGGLVALEMAQMLAAAGEEVALLALLDSALASSVHVDTSPTDDGGSTSAPPRSGAGLLERAKLPDGARLLRGLRLPLAGLVRYPGLAQFDIFYHQGRVLAKSYRVRPYAGRTVLYVAEDNPRAERDEWAAYLTGDAAIVAIPVEHHTMLNEPHVRVLADDLRRRLDATTTDS